jgi:hypothetical protein
MTLQLKHVCFDKYGAILMVNGKTGQRRVRLLLSSPKLYQWTENHPLKENLEAPLWVTKAPNSRNKVLKYSSIRSTLKKIAKKAGIEKRVYPHLFRHSRATHLANKLTEAQMKQYFGWTQSSKMASVYVHLSGRDVDQALLRINGIDVPKEEIGDIMVPLQCPRCKKDNSPDAKFCSMCGHCLDDKFAVKIEKTREKVDEIMNRLIENPRVLKNLLVTMQKAT